MTPELQGTGWTPNIILADADYVDKVVFDLTVNFERMLERRLPQADMARWAECVALDGGLRPGTDPSTPPAATTVILLHEQAATQLRNFQPSLYDSELNARAFNGQIGEFTIYSVATSPLADKRQLFADTLQMLLADQAVSRLMLVPSDEHAASVRQLIARADAAADKHVTLFTMQPAAGTCRQEQLGYSLMAAMGIRGEEFQS